MVKIEKLFDQFATGAATVLTGKRKNWPKVKAMSRGKNADVWSNVWIKTARPAAISALKSAKLGLTDTQIKALADDYGKKRKLEFVKLTTQTDIKRLKVLARSKGDLEGEIKEAGISRLSRKYLIEDNESLEAAKELLRGGHKAVGYTKKRWKTTSNKPCDICRAHEGEVRDIDKSYSNGSMHAHGHPGCLHPKMECLPIGGLVRAFRFSYYGDMLEIKTRNGKCFTVTPNHMILTPSGFLPANSLDKGSNIVDGAQIKRMVAINDDYDDVKTRIEDVFDALFMKGEMTTVSMPVSSEYFNGDGCRGYGEVNIVRPDSFLGYRVKSGYGEMFRKLDLQFRDATLKFFSSFCDGAFSLKRNLTTPRGVVRSFSYGFALFYCGFGISNLSSFMRGSGSSTQHEEPVLDEFPRHSEKGCDCESRVSFIKHLHNFLFRKLFRIPKPSFNRSFPHLNAMIEESLVDGGDGALIKFRDLFQTHPTSIKLDEVLNVKCFTYHGFVYDLESISNLCICNDILMHNCKCEDVFS